MALAGASFEAPSGRLRTRGGGWRERQLAAHLCRWACKRSQGVAPRRVGVYADLCDAALSTGKPTLVGLEADAPGRARETARSALVWAPAGRGSPFPRKITNKTFSPGRKNRRRYGFSGEPNRERLIGRTRSVAELASAINHPRPEAPRRGLEGRSVGATVSAIKRLRRNASKVDEGKAVSHNRWL